MGFGSFLKKTVKGIGKVAKGAAKFGLKGAYLPIRGVGRIARGDFKAGFGDILGGAARNAAIMGAIVGGPAALGALGSAGSAVGGAAGSLGGALGGAASGIGGALKGAGGKLIRGVGHQLLGGGGGGGGTDWPGLVMGGVNTFMNAKDATRNRGLEDEQIDFARQGMQRQRDIQDQILGSMNRPLNVPNLGNVFEDTSNPFYKPLAPPPNAGNMVSAAMGGIGAAPPNIPPMPAMGSGSGPALPPQPDPANDVMRRLRPLPIPRAGGGGGMTVPMDYRI